MLARGFALCAAAMLAFEAAAARAPHPPMATGRISAAALPYLPGSLIPLRVNGFEPPYGAAVLGPGRVSSDGVYEIAQDAPAGTALLVAGNSAGLAATRLRIGSPPAANRDLLVVASYDDGLVFHDATSFGVLGLLATGGAPSDT
ncbi:MAG TPA: hypothetical protein VEW74_06345, partial [Candidatus Nitrosotalea sp.]|nr:hypothetical protein [Candidatus Nitrosotalea sp.]